MPGDTPDGTFATNPPQIIFAEEQLSSFNARNSLLVSLPSKLLKLVSSYLTDPLDLLRFSYTCHALFSLITPADWYSLATYTYPNLVQSFGGPMARDWKTMVLKDAALGVRLGATLPLTDVISSTSSPTSSALTAVSSTLTSALSLPTSGTSPTITADFILSQPSSHLPPSPIDSKWSQLATSASPRLPSSLDEFDRRRPLRVELSEAQFFKTDRETQDTPGAPWVRMGSPIYNIDRDSQTAIAASMITRPKSVPSKSNGGDPRPHDHEILFYNLPDLTNPIARCGSDVWEMDQKTDTQALPWYHPFTRDQMQVVRVVAIKHYPEDTVGGMRVIFVIAIGHRARTWVNITIDSHFLSTWMMLKVIEVRLPVTPMTRLASSMMNHFQASPSLELKIARECVRVNPDSVLKYESLEHHQHQITMHGCFVKLYSAFDPRPFPTATTGGGQPSTPLDVDTGRKVDCIAIFGIQNSDAASAMVIRKVLFCDDDGSDLGGKTFSNKAVSCGVTCMTLFPDHSGYEHYLVLYSKEGRGMIWDWVHEKQITQLHLPIDKCKSKGDRRAGDEPANIGVVADGALATAKNPAGDAGVGEPSFPRRKMYYWGVQVSAAFNVSFPGDPNNAYNSNGAFRIVTMGDSADDEWVSCWWDITMDELQEPMASLPAPPIIDRNKSGSRLKTITAAWPPLMASVKRFQCRTYGVCIPEQQETHSAENNKPIQFLAYVIWNHYRISFSSRLGISMVDLEEPQPSGLVNRQWITFLKDREDLIDFEIFGHNLIITLKTGHLVWSFYGKDRTSFVSNEGLGLRMDTGLSLESDSMNNTPTFVQ
ncbi:hypothetical protein K457DRAFT_21358 [Linnemannia elongata AG-77]|uniref:F-box domain-containing protein n=1 Tax=Linnemannia elongata AG-77 TaxID=1314771 RepID=A0A197JR87_9FUNG|nr:hypothetical protein K457DRAFT_21358 [Linnemannia elongata AG-77]